MPINNKRNQYSRRNDPRPYFAATPAPKQFTEGDVANLAARVAEHPLILAAIASHVADQVSATQATIAAQVENAVAAAVAAAQPAKPAKVESDNGK